MNNLHRLLSLPLIITFLRLCSNICSALILGLRPILGPATCKYELTCTQYAVQQLQDQPFFTAVWRIVKRLFLCNPFTK